MEIIEFHITGNLIYDLIETNHKYYKYQLNQMDFIEQKLFYNISTISMNKAIKINTFML